MKEVVRILDKEAVEHVFNVGYDVFVLPRKSEQESKQTVGYIESSSRQML